MNAVIDAFGWSEAGNRHPQSPGNQDSLLYRCLPGAERAETPFYDFVAAVADGITQSANGQAAAKVAAEAVVQGLDSQWRAKADLIQEEKDDYRGFEDLVIKAFHTAHTEVRQQAPSGKTVLALACVQGDRLLAGNLGDTRIYLFRASRLIQLSEDHRGEVGVTGVLGGGTPQDPSLVVHPLQEGDLVLLCTDGFYEAMEQQVLEQILIRRSAQSAYDLAAFLQAHWQQARPALHDDATLLVARIDRPGVPFWSAEASAAPAAEAAARAPARERSAPRTAARQGKPEADRSEEPALAALAERVDRLTKQLANARLLLFTDGADRVEAGAAEREAHRALVEYLVTRLEEAPLNREELRKVLPPRRRSWLGPDAARWVLPLVALLGIGVGWFGRDSVPSLRALVAPGSEQPASARLLKPQYPPDLGRAIRQEIQGDYLVLIYVPRQTGEGNADGQRRMALYRLAGDGSPETIIPLASVSAPGSGPAARAPSPRRSEP